MAQSNRWWLFPRVQFALLVLVGDHNHGLLMYAFGNLCTSIYQCDSPIWGDNNSGFTSLMIFFYQGVPLLGGTIWQYQLPLIQATHFSSWVEWDLSYNRWCHQRCHLVVNGYNCLDILLVEQAVVPPVASTDSHPDVGCQVSWDNTQKFPDVIIIKTRVFFIQEISFVFFLIRNLCGLFDIFPLQDLSQCN